MKKIFTFLTCLIIVGISCSNILAQGCDEPADSGDSDDSLKPKIIGFAQPQYEFHFTEDEDRNIKNTNTFKFKRTRLGVTGKIPYDFAYYAMMEFSPFVSQTGNPYLLDVFISYRRFKWANVSMGSFKQPFGLEVNTACSGLHTIERSAASDQLVVPQRDMGIMIFGGKKTDFIKYQFAIMNGTGLGSTDNNNQKDFIGRVVFHPVDFIGIGGSFRYGYPNSIPNASNRPDTLTRTSFAVELEVDYANFLLQTEYIHDEGEYNRAAGGGCGSDPLILGEKRSGFYVQAMYMTHFNLQPVIKYEFFDTGDDDEYQISTLTFGLNYFFNDNIRVQANYRYNAEYNKDSNAEIPNDAALLQLQVKF